eukprot:UN18567
MKTTHRMKRTVFRRNMLVYGGRQRKIYGLHVVNIMSFLGTAEKNNEKLAASWVNYNFMTHGAKQPNAGIPPKKPPDRHQKKKKLFLCLPNRHKINTTIINSKIWKIN